MEKKIKIKNYNNMYNHYHNNYWIRVEKGKAHKIEIVDYGAITYFELINRTNFRIKFIDGKKELDWTIFRFPKSNKRLFNEFKVDTLPVKVIGDYQLFYEFKKG